MYIMRFTNVARVPMLWGWPRRGRGKKDEEMAFVIAGVTGNTGKVVAETLLADKKAVRVVVRDAAKGGAWKDKGAEVAVADLGDAKALAAALTGAEGAYLLVPPSMTEPSFAAYQDRVIESLATAIEAAKVPHVVFLSSVGAQHAGGTGPIAGLHRAEQRFARIPGTAFSHVRAAYFMENLAGSLGTLAQGAISSFLPATFALPMIATRDIGRVAAKLLVEGTKQTQIIELSSGPYSAEDAADALGKITSKRPTVQVAPLDAVVPAFTSFGMPKDLAELYREMLEGITKGHVSYDGAGRKVVGETSLEDVLRGLVGAG